MLWRNLLEIYSYTDNTIISGVYSWPEVFCLSEGMGYDTVLTCGLS